ncbi:MAG: galactose oxidase-like domain-containing protein [Planctomycetota bacterium JB042]
MIRIVIGLVAAGAWAAVALAAENDAWSEVVTWRTADGSYASAVHATLMPDGSVVCVGFKRDAADAAAATEQQRAVFRHEPTPLGAPLPAERVVSEFAPPLDADPLLVPPYLVLDDLFCSGQTLLADGSLLHVGGTRAILSLETEEVSVLGLPYAARFDGVAWSREPNDMITPGPFGEPARWYPTVTRLADGRALVTGGYDVVAPVASFNRSTEIFDPETGTWETHSPSGVPPEEIVNADYTHAVVLPESAPFFDVLLFGHAGSPVLMSLDGAFKWLSSGTPRPGTLAGELPNLGASTALLPLRVDEGEWGYANGAVLIAGGGDPVAHQPFADVYDPIAAAWLSRVDTGVRRHHPSTVVLPDGRVLIVAGHDKQGGDGVRRATFIDPRRGFAVTHGAAESAEVRGYHAVSLLLPDGRVLVGGGRDAVTEESAEKVTFRYYSPPYVFRERPRVTKHPKNLQRNVLALVESKGARPVEAVLVALGSMTHSFDTNQRAVEVPIVSSLPTADGWISALAPPADAGVLPAGHYMLFLVDRDRTPSRAPIVRVGG